MPRKPTCADIEKATCKKVAFLALQKEFESPTFRLGDTEGNDNGTPL